MGNLDRGVGDRGFGENQRAASADPPAGNGPVADCPKCGRKLLSTRSILCNWCGARIDDADYLERAAQERAALDARMRHQIDSEMAEAAQFGVLGRLKRKGKGNLQTELNVLVPSVDKPQNP